MKGYDWNKEKKVILFKNGQNNMEQNILTEKLCFKINSDFYDETGNEMKLKYSFYKSALTQSIYDETSAKDLNIRLGKEKVENSVSIDMKQKLENIFFNYCEVKKTLKCIMIEGVLSSVILLKIAWLVCMITMVNAGTYPPEPRQLCLTGSFVNVQSWAMENGTLNPKLNSSISMDLSADPMRVQELRTMLKFSRMKIGKDSETYVARINYDRDNYDIDDTDFSMVDLDWVSPFTFEELANIVFLSLANNELDRIPLFYSDSNGTNTVHFRELRYLSFYGNNFGASSNIARSSSDSYIVTLNATEYKETSINNNDGIVPTNKVNTNWVGDLKNLQMPALLELDLRNCSIYVLDHETFESLPNLRRLYLSKNKIYQIGERTFAGLSELVHLDLSYNVIPLSGEATTDVIDGMSMSLNVFRPLVKLKSLDYSFTKIVQTCGKVFGQLSHTVERLSVCHTKFPGISKGMFANTSMKVLDISGNYALDTIGDEAFRGIEGTLEVLFANHLGIRSIHFLENLTKLRILSLSDNEITSIENVNLDRLEQLKVLDLNNNRISNWNTPVFSKMNKLHVIQMVANSINIMTVQMLLDFKNIEFLSLADNGFVCNCFLKGFIARAMSNGIKSLEAEENIYPHWYLNASDQALSYEIATNMSYVEISENIKYQNAYNFYSRVLKNRNKQFQILNDSEIPFILNDDGPDENTEDFFNFTTTLLDYMNESEMCFDYKTNLPSTYYDIDCKKPMRRKDFDDSTDAMTALVVSLVILAVFVMIGAVAFWKRWYVRYFFMMLKNAAVLSVMGKETSMKEADKVFTYDVFVSYCDEDRPWVLEQLLPEVENNTPVSVCLHERDFQVGLSILENIISCMDRSRSLMMVVSKQFLLSHWCQFEMHLAQHRLIETRREQLILVLLEDIPRSKRPNTLHYLMMTKTYIVWPKSTSERGTFWKRLRKALVHGKTVASERCSSA